MQAEWHIQRRAGKCSATERPFQDGETFYTLLFQEKDGLRREDLSEEAWAGRELLGRPFSHWRSRFEAPPASAPEPLPRKGAEELLRRLVLEDDARHLNARYILAIMLERKKILKPVDEKPNEEGRLLIYEHVRSGEVFLIQDPMLRIDQIEAVQSEVFSLLNENIGAGQPLPDLPA